MTAHSHHFNDMFSAKAKTLQNHNFQKPTPLTTRSLSLSLYIHTYIYIHRKIDRCVIPMHIYMMLHMRACTVSQCISWISKAHWQPPRWWILLPGSHELLWRWLGPSFRPRFCSKHTTCRVQGATECGCLFLVLNHLLFESAFLHIYSWTSLFVLQ